MRFSTTFTVTAGPAEVYEHLMDPNHYVGLTPLVVAVRDVRAVDGGFEYVAIERFRFGPFRWDNPIRVTMTGVPHVVTSRVAGAAGVRLTATTTSSPGPSGGTVVVEEVDVTAPWLLRWFVERKAREAAAGRSRELARRFARPSSG